MKTSNQQISTATSTIRALTVGEYAHALIDEQYRNVVKHEKKVIADRNPEHLHRMRVSTRKLRTALQVFDHVIELPKAAAAKRIGSLAKVLGKLRDLDVQTASLQTHYRPNLNKADQRSLDKVITHLQAARREALTDVVDALTRSRYRALKASYEAWLDRPCYTSLASQPLQPLIPDLLSPIVSTLLLHPGWLVQPDQDAGASNDVLHDLRKACKHVRYQAEFFAPFYSESFQSWIEDIKAIQSMLGTVQDSEVLQALLDQHLPKSKKVPALKAAVKQTETETLSDWDSIRQRYLDPAFRYHLHHLLLAPIGVNAPATEQVCA